MCGLAPPDPGHGGLASHHWALKRASETPQWKLRLKAIGTESPIATFGPDGGSEFGSGAGTVVLGPVGPGGDGTAEDVGVDEAGGASTSSGSARRSALQSAPDWSWPVK